MSLICSLLISAAGATHVFPAKASHKNYYTTHIAPVLTAGEIAGVQTLKDVTQDMKNLYELATSDSSGSDKDVLTLDSLISKSSKVKDLVDKMTEKKKEIDLEKNATKQSLLTSQLRSLRANYIALLDDEGIKKIDLSDIYKDKNSTVNAEFAPYMKAAHDKVLSVKTKKASAQADLTTEIQKHKDLQNEFVALQGLVADVIKATNDAEQKLVLKIKEKNKVEEDLKKKTAENNDLNDEIKRLKALASGSSAANPPVSPQGQDDDVFAPV